MTVSICHHSSNCISSLSNDVGVVSVAYIQLYRHSTKYIRLERKKPRKIFIEKKNLSKYPFLFQKTYKLVVILALPRKYCNQSINHIF